MSEWTKVDSGRGLCLRRRALDVGKSSKKLKPSTPWRATEIVWRNPKDLKPHPDNPKVHPPEQLRALGEAIEEFGFDQPILVDEGDFVLKGHGRREAAMLKSIDQVPTIPRPGLSEAQKLALVISDNQLPLLGSWDGKLLRLGMSKLQQLNYPLKRIGFDSVRLATFIGQAPGGENPDAQPEIPAHAVSRKGDVWQLGEHVLHCGDCAKVRAPESVRLQLTDPPYEFETVEGGGIQAKRTYPKKMAAAGVDSFSVDQVDLVAKTNIFFTSKELIADYLQLAIAKDENWDLNVLHRAAAMPNIATHLMTDLDYIVVIGAMGPNRGLELPNYSKMLSLGHWERPVPWAKPIEVLTKYIRLFSAPGDLVLDPYCGSGSTIIACSLERRKCFAVELLPEFVDVAIKRWQKWSGQKAVLQSSKKTFEQMERERAPKKKAA